MTHEDLGLIYKAIRSWLKPKKLTQFKNLHAHNSISQNTSQAQLTKLNKTSKPVSSPVSTWLTAFRSQQLLVLLTAACYECKIQVQSGVKEIDC